MTLLLSIIFSVFLSSPAKAALGPVSGFNKQGPAKAENPYFELQAPVLADPNCAQYKVAIKSFRPASDLLSAALAELASFRPASDLISMKLARRDQDNPFIYIEDCILKAADTHLRPICKEEKALQTALQNPKNNPLEIQERLDYVSDLKYESADVLYAFADEADEIFKDLENSDPEGGWDRVYNFLITHEAGSYADVTALAVQSLCGSDLSYKTKSK